MRAIRRFATIYRSIRRESSNGLGYAGAWFCRRFYLRFVYSQFSPPLCTPEDREHPLTVVVPAAEKDVQLLPLCLRGIRKNVLQRVEQILVVAPDSKAIRQIALEEGAAFVDENEVLPERTSCLQVRGWILQQFLKLNAADVVKTADYMVLDTDTILLRPQTFFSRGRTVLKFSDQYELLYNASLRALLGDSHRFPVSFVTHHMVMNCERVRQLHRMIEGGTGMPWHRVILSRVDHEKPVSLSEFELYGNFLSRLTGFKREFLLSYWHGQDFLRREYSATINEKLRSLETRFNSASFHG
jgi:hypothetical protein